MEQFSLVEWWGSVRRLPCGWRVSGQANNVALSIALQIVGLTALSCGLIFIGSCDDNLTDTFLQMMLEKSDDELSNTYMRFVALGISLLYLGKQEKAEVPLAALQAVGNPLGVIARTLLEICAYTGVLYIAC